MPTAVPPSQLKPEATDEDARRAGAGYVEVSGGSRCGNCEHLDRAKQWCTFWQFAVNLRNGCCDDWEAQQGIPARDWRAQAAAASGVGKEAAPATQPPGEEATGGRTERREPAAAG